MPAGHRIGCRGPDVPLAEEEAVVCHGVPARQRVLRRGPVHADGLAGTDGDDDVEMSHRAGGARLDRLRPSTRHRYEKIRGTTTAWPIGVRREAADRSRSRRAGTCRKRTDDRTRREKPDETTEDTRLHARILDPRESARPVTTPEPVFPQTTAPQRERPPTRAASPTHIARQRPSWRWGESNPRPLLWSCAFYGRSQCSRFLGPGACRWHLLRRAQYQLESLCALMLNAEASSLADARVRVENSSRSDGLFSGEGELTPRGRSRPWPRQCSWNRHLFFRMDR